MDKTMIAYCGTYCGVCEWKEKLGCKRVQSECRRYAYHVEWGGIMAMKKQWNKLTAMLLVAGMAVSMCLSMTGCTTASATNLMDGVTPRDVAADVDLTAYSAAVTDFSVRLFQNSTEPGKNTLISPFSVLCALAMTANGAKGETLSQMEDVLGLTTAELNAFIHTYMEQLPEAETYKLNLANSIWFTDKDSFTVNEDFLQTNADYYGAGIYKAPFDDSTLKDINNWVEDNTDGMIKDILDQIPESVVMYLVNALAFDAEWQKVYEETQVKDGVFTTEDGIERKVELMHSEEHRYLEDKNAAGFLKYYDDRSYAFVALLPNEGVSVEEYVATLTGEHLQELLNAADTSTVFAAIPKFESEYSVEMREILMEMGMPSAFGQGNTDFSGLGTSTEGDIAISRVLHKTYIAVDEKGTKAGAATVVEANAGSAPVEPEETKTVILDRPFVYMLIDCENNLPFFIGTVMDVE